MTSPPVVHQHPRISTNDLARFMVSSDTGRLGIIRRAKQPQTFVVTRYRDIRDPICNFLADPARNPAILTTVENHLRQRANDPAETALRQDDARAQIEVLASLRAMAGSIGSATYLTQPANRPSSIMIEGVQVSVRLDLQVEATARGIAQVGGAILRMTQDDADTPAARDRRRDMGTYVATLARMYLDAHYQGNRTITNRLCMSIDIQHGEIFAAPTGLTQRIGNLRAACQVIAALWPTA